MTPRLPPRVMAESDPAARRVFALLEGDGRRPSPLFQTLAHAPKMLEAWVSMSRPLRSETTLSSALRELMIMRIAQMMDAGYAWAYHRDPALKSGIAERQLQMLADWRTSVEFDERQRVVLAYAEAIADASVDDTTYESIAAFFDAAEIVELTVIAAFYCTVCRVLQALHIEVDPALASFIP